MNLATNCKWKNWNYVSFTDPWLGPLLCFFYFLSDSSFLTFISSFEFFLTKSWFESVFIKSWNDVIERSNLWAEDNLMGWCFLNNEAPSDVNKFLDGSTYPRWKMSCFVKRVIFLMCHQKKKQQAIMRDQ